MPQGLTQLDVHWGTEVAAWVFTVSRDHMVWRWTVTPEQFKQMLERMQTMDDEFNCLLGAKLREQVNKGDEQ